LDNVLEKWVAEWWKRILYGNIKMDLKKIVYRGRG
jgi:hypothetical protein